MTRCRAGRGRSSRPMVIQEFVYSVTFISSVQKMTMSVGIPVALVRGDVATGARSWPPASSRACRWPSLYNFFLDRFIAGFTVGAIK
jgi:multiple sugar transport system permease protein